MKMSLFEIYNDFANDKNILDIGFGSGDNLVNISLNQPNDCLLYKSQSPRELDQSRMQ